MSVSMKANISADGRIRVGIAAIFTVLWMVFYFAYLISWVLWGKDFPVTTAMGYSEKFLLCLSLGVDTCMLLQWGLNKLFSPKKE